MEKFDLVLVDAASTKHLGALIGKFVENKACAALQGPLGSGKTTLVQGVAEGLGISDVVSSPTFTMLNEYHSGRLPLYHLDLYRYKDIEESLSASSVALLRAELDELTRFPSLILMEWAELIPSLLADDHLLIELDYNGAEDQDGRKASISASGPGGKKLVLKLKSEMALA